MQINDLPFVNPVTPAQAKYRETVEAIADALTALKEQASGPAVATNKEKQQLLEANMPLMERFVRAWRAFTVAGGELSATELKEHRPYAQALLHPFILQSPFAHRCFTKPLGYAGDYVMVRYILDNPFQGDSAFAQLVNYALVQADVAQGHRNRIAVLERVLGAHAAQAESAGRKATGLTIGCGPAEETYRFVRNSEHANSLNLTLLDFNKETLNWTQDRLTRACLETNRAPELAYVEESVYNLAKKKAAAISPEYDLVVCAGLFDYLTDTFCKRVIEFGARSLLPGGKLLVTNVSKSTSSFGMSEVLEWDLIYRTADELEALLPNLDGFTHKVYVDETGTNVVAEMMRQ